jgi:hypothetical protein
MRSMMFLGLGIWYLTPLSINNISVISLRSVLLVEESGIPGDLFGYLLYLMFVDVDIAEILPLSNHQSFSHI